MAISDGIPPGRVARTVGVETVFQNLRAGVALLPMQIGLIGQGASAATYLLEKKQVLSAFEVGQIYGFGSPLHLTALELLPPNNDGIGTIPLIIYPLEDDAGGAPAVGLITPTVGPQAVQKTYIVKVNGILSENITIPATTTAVATIPFFIAGINAVDKMPVIATDGTTKVDLTAKWEGSSGNDLKIEIIGEESGVLFGITQPVGGLANPDVQDALDLVGSEWVTLFLNCLEIADTIALQKFTDFGEGRRLPIQPKPFISFTGNNEEDVTLAVVVSDSRKTDRINSQLVAPDSINLPFMIAARELARIAVIANENPPTDYAGQLATGLIPGADIKQWNDTELDFAVKAGSSTIQLLDGVIELSDTVTFYHPSGEDPPPWRYVVDILKVMNVTFNIRKIFESQDWKGKVLIPNGQATTNPNAKRPTMAIADVAKMVDGLALEAIISDPDAAKASIVAGINSGNPKRLDLSFTYSISGNTNIISITQNWGFFFGTQVAA